MSPDPARPLISHSHKASLRRTSYLEFVPEDTGANSGTGLFMKQRNTQQEDLSVAHGMGNVVHNGSRGRGCTDPVVPRPGTGWHPSCPRAVPCQDLTLLPQLQPGQAQIQVENCYAPHPPSRKISATEVSVAKTSVRHRTRQKHHLFQQHHRKKKESTLF